MLWFAFILLSLSYWKQLLNDDYYVACCCDLLSFYYLCRTGNNYKNIYIINNKLWFAFILLSLSYWKQPVAIRFLCERCCDLLSFYYLCRTGNNVVHCCPPNASVVICFHFTIFVVLETTVADWNVAVLGCDLLSFYYLCRTGNNCLSISANNKEVVICFHFTIFVVLETTNMGISTFLYWLWFAFILLSLSYWKQQKEESRTAMLCCDLLSFYYLCRTGNNCPCTVQ